MTAANCVRVFVASWQGRDERRVGRRVSIHGGGRAMNVLGRGCRFMTGAGHE
jgi:hypothetical protein